MTLRTTANFRIFAIALSLLCAASSGAQGAPKAEVLTTIETLDAPRYMGRWYEIAKYPNVFQRNCIGFTSADYAPLANGEVSVANRCRQENGDTIEASGTARQVGDANSPKLKVRFAPAWLSWLPWVWGDYWVIDIDDAYQLVAVSEPERDYLWVLSRTPTVDAARYAALLARLGDQGFDLDRLEVTPQGSGVVTVR